MSESMRVLMLVLRCMTISMACFAVLAQRASAQKWDLQRTLTIGTLDEKGTTLSVIQDALITRDDEIWVLLPQESLIRRFTADGMPLGEFGNPGDGPGDLTGPVDLTESGSGVAVTEASNRRVSVFSRDGQFLHVINTGTLETSYLGVLPEALLADGSVLALARGSGSMAAITRPDAPAQTFLKVAAPGGEVQPVAQAVGRGGHYALRSGRGVMYFAYPFGTNTRYSVSPRGEGFAVAHSSRIGDDGDSTEVVLHRFTASGDTAFTVAVVRPSVSLPRSVRDTAFARIVSAAVRTRVFDEARPALAELERTVDGARYYPPVVQLVVGSDGSTWVREPDATGQREMWTVYSRAGEVLAEDVEHPAGSRLLYVDDRRALFAGAGAFGEPQLVLYRVSGFGSDGDASLYGVREGATSIGTGIGTFPGSLDYW